MLIDQRTSQIWADYYRRRTHRALPAI